MSLSIVKRPIGSINSTSSNTATYTNNSSVITRAGHGLITGATIYISSGQYIGYWYVTPLTANTFNIREYAGSTVKTFIGSGSFNYFASVDNAGHNWSSVHLPIVYKLSSNLWPINSVDSVFGGITPTNDNGYCKIDLPGDLKVGVATNELEYVQVLFADGVTYAQCRIIRVYSNDIFTINLAYGVTPSFNTVQYYTNNYHARVRIYAGLTSSHFFNTVKPYSLLAELKIIPDSSGVVTANINEIIKSKIEVLKNDLTKGTLQNNLDAFCQFYISYAEAYDYAPNGYTTLDYISSYTNDSFNGVAVNADLPFKNIAQGFMSDYLYGNSATKLKFLTPSIYPVLNAGQFFDMSFINQIGARLRMKREAYKNGQIVNLFFDDINDYGIGIYRYEVAQSVYLEDRIDLTLQWNDYTAWIDISEVKTITVNSECYSNIINLSWLNSLGGFDYWAFKANSDYGVDIEGSTQTTKNIYSNWPLSFGAGADSINIETSRTSRQAINVRAENLTRDQVNDLFRIKLSPLLQIVTSRTDRRTVIADKNSFVYYKQREKLFNMSFNISFTDTLPAQSL
jgi:hypothetical protein